MPRPTTTWGLPCKPRDRLAEAIACYRRALQLKPDYRRGPQQPGDCLARPGADRGGVACYRRAVQLKPDFAEAHNNLGNALQGQGQIAEALACYQRALQLKPDYAEAHNNLGNVLKDMGRLDEALAAYRRALELRPDSPSFHSNLVYALHFHPDADARLLGAEHQRWYQRHAAPLAKLIRPHANDPDPDRRLRVGYVSADFRDHVVGRNLLPLLREHDHEQVEIFCYANGGVARRV